MKKEDCIFNKIKLFHQNIDKKEIKNLMNNVYRNIMFSTFPYLKYKKTDSKYCVQHYRSGNCIAFCYFIKIYLKKHYNLISYIVGASVPSLFKVNGTPNICHCAVLLPINTYEFYIIDCALYFCDPIFCSISDNKKRNVYFNLITDNLKIKTDYKIEKSKYLMIDQKYNQILPDETLNVKINITKKQYDFWEYYLCEINNPDNNIGHSYLKYKKKPFLLYTEIVDDSIKLKYKINYENNNFIIKKYPENIIIYDGNNNYKVYIDIIEKLYHYLPDNKNYHTLCND